jgi:hypothetical protein
MRHSSTLAPLTTQLPPVLCPKPASFDVVISHRFPGPSPTFSSLNHRDILILRLYLIISTLRSAYSREKLEEVGELTNKTFVAQPPLPTVDLTHPTLDLSSIAIALPIVVRN